MFHGGHGKLLDLWLGKIFILLHKAASMTLFSSQNSFGSGLIRKTTTFQNRFGGHDLGPCFLKCLFLSLHFTHRSICLSSNEQNGI